MAAENRDKAISLILALEGGSKVTNDPRDPGKTTKYGISQNAHPHLDIENLTEDQAKSIYDESYWSAASCDHIRSGLDLLVFDSAVNQGVGAAIRMLQVASGTKPDGIVGSATLAASAMPGVSVKFARERALRYAANPLMNVYGKGWMQRLFHVFELAIGMQK